jgi:hypothetical protein
MDRQPLTDLIHCLGASPLGDLYRTSKENVMSNLSTIARERVIEDAKNGNILGINTRNAGNKYLLLARKDLSGLFVDKNGYLIFIRGNVVENDITIHSYDPKRAKSKKLNTTLERINDECLGLKNFTRAKILRYFIPFEMEIERIFNNFRYKYIQAVQLTNFANQEISNCFNASHNNAFKTLAGINIYQGNVKERKNNDEFWKEKSFSPDAKDTLHWEKERLELDIVISFARYLFANYLTHCERLISYTELMAIKPGLHELYVHNDYFDTIFKNPKSIRDKVFQFLRNQAKSLDFQIDKLPKEINKQAYLTYASCNITEGPFVFRKNSDTLYADEIRKCTKPEDLRSLKNSFHILAYHNDEINSSEKLNKLLKDAEPYLCFMHQLS